MKKFPLNRFLFVLNIILKIVNASIIPNNITTHRTAALVKLYGKHYSGNEPFMNNKSSAGRSTYLVSKPYRHHGKLVYLCM